MSIVLIIPGRSWLVWSSRWKGYLGHNDGVGHEAHWDVTGTLRGVGHEHLAQMRDGSEVSRQ